MTAACKNGSAQIGRLDVKAYTLIMNRRSIQFTLAAGVLSLCLTGCNLFDKLTNHGKEVEARVSKLASAINGKKWNDVAALANSDFSFTDVRGKVHKGGNGIRAFRNGFLALPDSWAQFYIKTKITKINDKRFLVMAEMRLRIRTHAAASDNIVWHTQQTWVKVSNAQQKFDWKLQAIKDTTGKFGNQGQKYADGPPLP